MALYRDENGNIRFLEYYASPPAGWIKQIITDTGAIVADPNYVVEIVARDNIRWIIKENKLRETTKLDKYKWKLKRFYRNHRSLIVNILLVIGGLFFLGLGVICFLLGLQDLVKHNLFGFVEVLGGGAAAIFSTSLIWTALTH